MLLNIALLDLGKGISIQFRLDRKVSILGNWTEKWSYEHPDDEQTV